MAVGQKPVINFNWEESTELNLKNINLSTVDLATLSELRRNVYIADNVNHINLTDSHLAKCPFSEDPEHPLQGNIVRHLLIHFISSETLETLTIAQNNFEDTHPSIFEAFLDVIKFCNSLKCVNVQHCTFSYEQFKQFVDAIDNNEGITNVIYTLSKSYESTDTTELARIMRAHRGTLTTAPYPEKAEAEKKTSSPLYDVTMTSHGAGNNGSMTPAL